jgi:hypothetical protein
VFRLSAHQAAFCKAEGMDSQLYPRRGAYAI